MRYLVLILLFFCFQMIGCTKNAEAPNSAEIKKLDGGSPAKVEKVTAPGNQKPLEDIADNPELSIIETDNVPVETDSSTLMLDAITVFTPQSGSTIRQKYGDISITGVIENYQSEWFVRAGEFLHKGAEIDASGNFKIDNFLLQIGENKFDIVLYNGSSEPPVELAREEMTLHYLPDRDAVVQIGAGQAGSLNVTDTSSPISGVGFEMSTGATNETLVFTLYSDPEHLPNLPFEYVRLSEAVSLTPWATELNKFGQLRIPYDITQLPEDTLSDDVVILARGDEGWKELPIISSSGGLVSAEVDGLYYDPYVAAIKKAK